MIPGEIITAAGDLELNAGRDTVVVEVANTGDRPIQVGSHYHFYETNAALRFDLLAGVMPGGGPARSIMAAPSKAYSSGYARGRKSVRSWRGRWRSSLPS